jgi:hypothetical protein
VDFQTREGDIVPDQPPHRFVGVPAHDGHGVVGSGGNPCAFGQGRERRRRQAGPEGNLADRHMAADIIHCPVGGNGTRVEDHHPPGKGLDFLEVVAGDQQGAAIAPVFTEAFPEVFPGFHIQARGGLIQDHKPRPAHQGQGHHQPALLSAGQPAALFVRYRAEPEVSQQFRCGHRIAVVGGHKIHGLADPQRGWHRCGLRCGPEFAPGLRITGIAAEKLHRPGVGGADAAQEVQQRGLPGPVGSEQAKGLSGTDRQTDFGERRFSRVTLGHGMCRCQHTAGKSRAGFPGAGSLLGAGGLFADGTGVQAHAVSRIMFGRCGAGLVKGLMSAAAAPRFAGAPIPRVPVRSAGPEALCGTVRKPVFLPG